MKKLAGYGDALPSTSSQSTFSIFIYLLTNTKITINYTFIFVTPPDSLFETSQSLFWASFGLVDLMAFELQGIKSFTRFWAMLMFGSYSVINIIVLLNMLIAMMSNSYQIISVNKVNQ